MAPEQARQRDGLQLNRQVCYDYYLTIVEGGQRSLVGAGSQYRQHFYKLHCCSLLVVEIPAEWVSGLAVAALRPADEGGRGPGGASDSEAVMQGSVRLPSAWPSPADATLRLMR